MVTNIGDTDAKTIVSDHATPASGTYAWYIKAKPEIGVEPRSPIVDEEFAAEVALKEKYFDLKAVYRMNNIHIKNSTDYINLKKALETWEAGNTRLYLSVKNEWGVELAVRGSKDNPTTLTQYRGKLFIFKWVPMPSEVITGVEFHYTTA